MAKEGNDEAAAESALEPVAGGPSSLFAGVGLDRVRQDVKARLFGEALPSFGRYEVLRRLGAGAMGVVYLARDPDLDRLVAIKRLRPGGSAEVSAETGDAGAEPRTDPGLLRLAGEAKAMAKLSHPNVATVYEVARADDAMFVAMEYVEGETLRAWHHGEPRSWQETVRMHVQAGRGLAAAHRAGVVHRDYKPDNVLVGSDGRPRVVDFGLARAGTQDSEARVGAVDPVGDTMLADPSARADAVAVTRTGWLLGTPAYMAPEQLRGARADARADQFAFCVTLFEGLFGVRPFQGSTVEALARNVIAGELRDVDRPLGLPPSLFQVLRRGLEREASARHASMDELIDAIDAAVAPHPRARRGWIWASGAATIIGAGLLALGASPSREPRPDLVEAAQESPGDPRSAVLAASELPEPIPIPLADDPLGVTIHRLSNGVTVYIATMRERPRIFAEVVVRAGSRDERPGETGVAHLLEHMMFKGTPALGTTDWEREEPLLARRDALAEKLETTTDPAERDRILGEIEAVVKEAAQWAVPREHSETLERLGAKAVNAMTTSEYCAFLADIPSPRFEAWARLEAERLRRPVFRGFFPELSVVVEELRMLRDGRGESFDALRQALFEGSSLAHNPIGRDEDLARPPFSAMRAFHRTFYVPNNTAIVLVGDIDARRALPVLEAEFAGWEPAEIERPPPPGELAPGVRERTVTGTLPVPLLMGWRGPKPHEPDELALNLVVEALNRGQGGFHDELVTRGPLARVGAMSSQGVLGIYASPDDEGALATAEAAVLETLERVADGDLPQRLLDAVRQARAVTWLEAASDPQQVGLMLAASFGERRSWNAEIEARTEMNSLSVEDIAAAVRRLLARGRVVVRQSDAAYVPPRISLPALEPIDYPTGAKSAFALEVERMPAAPLQPEFLSEGRDYRITNTPFGRAIATRVPGETYRVDIVIPRGSGADLYLCHAVELWGKAGTPDISRDELEAKWSAAGIQVDVSCRRADTWVTVSGVENSRAGAWETFEAWLNDARIDERLVERRGAELRNRWRGVYDSPAILQSALSEYAKYRDRADLMTAASAEELRTVSAARLDESLQRLRATPSTILYAGPLDAVPTGTGIRPSVAPEAPRGSTSVSVPERTEILLLDDPRRDQAHVEVLAVSEPMNPEDRATGELWEQYMGKGMSGMIFRAIRESRGAAYTANATFTWPRDPDDRGVATLVFGTEPGRVVETLEVALDVLRGDVHPTAFDEARSRFEAELRSHRTPPLEIPRQVWVWEREGFEQDPHLSSWSASSRIDLERFSSFHRALGARPLTIVIAGDVERMDLERLASIAPVRRVRPADFIHAADVTDPGAAR